MKYLFSITLFLAMSSGLQAQCNAKFSPDLVQPRIWSSFSKVVASFIATPTQAQRLADLRNEIITLRRDKMTLLDTLKGVSQQASVQDWQKAKFQQIPGIEMDVARLFISIHEEFQYGGLFAGKPEYREISDLLDMKSKQMNNLCLFVNAALPLTPQDHFKMNSMISSLSDEVNELAKIDDGIAKLVEVANNEASKKSPKK